MPTVTCPTCGEKGKIAPDLIGARIKCKKCGSSFLISPPAAKAVAAAASATSAAGHTPEGIQVEGLDASTWTLSNETGVTLHAEAKPDAVSGHHDSSAHFEASSAPVETRQYKLLTSKDKSFEGKFDLARLEEVINLHARQGWVVKAMTLPHIKGYGGVIEETVVVLLER
jgi:Domain of unknown function (DUF4177)